MVLVGLAVFLGVHFLAEGGSDQVVSQPTVTTSVAPGGAVITAQQALEQIVSLVRAVPTKGKGQMPSPPGERLGPVQEAIALGLLHSSEISGIQPGKLATQKQFAVWLWRGFGTVLPNGSATTRISDIGGLTTEERQAVEGLVRDGIVQLPKNGAFDGNRVLTSAEASILLDRVKSLVQRSSSS